MALSQWMPLKLKVDHTPQKTPFSKAAGDKLSPQKPSGMASCTGPEHFDSHFRKAIAEVASKKRHSLKERQDESVHGLLGLNLGLRNDNFIAFHNDDTMIIWHPKDQLLYALRIKDGRKLSHIQTLGLTDPPTFDISSIFFSDSGRFLALVGSHGVQIVAMPRKWGSYGLFEGGKDTILCKSWPIAERYFVCSRRTMLVQCRWFPSSSNNSQELNQEKYILMLMNDNCLRLYDIEKDIQEPVSIIKIPGVDPLESSLNSRISTDYHAASSAFTLDEIAVSFDIGPSPSSSTNSDWSVYVLKANGDIFQIILDLNGQRPTVHGPLTMLPPAEDNYGTDASSILCLGDIHPLIVIATSNGTIHHCVPVVNKQTNQFQEPTLYVYETIELSLTLSQSEKAKLSSTRDYNDLCPIHLIRDPTSKSRYFCMHYAGVHAIGVPFLEQLSNTRSSQSERFREEESIVEHMICTSPIKGAHTSSATPFPMGLAIGIHRGRPYLVVVLSSSEILSQHLSAIVGPSNLLVNPLVEENLLSEEAGKEIAPKIQFKDKVSELLRRTSSAPLLKTGQQRKHPHKLNEETLQMLMTATEILRRQYLQKMQLASHCIEKRISALKNDKRIQLNELQSLQQQVNEVRNRHDGLQTKISQAKEKQGELATRMDELLAFVHSDQDTLSEAEWAMLIHLKDLKSRVDHFKTKFEEIERKYNYQQDLRKRESSNEMDGSIRHLHILEESAYRVGGELSANQLPMIKHSLAKEGEEIAELMQRINSLRKNVSGSC